MAEDTERDLLALGCLTASCCAGEQEGFARDEHSPGLSFSRDSCSGLPPAEAGNMGQGLIGETMRTSRVIAMNALHEVGDSPMRMLVARRAPKVSPDTPNRFAVHVSGQDRDSIMNRSTASGGIGREQRGSRAEEGARLNSVPRARVERAAPNGGGDGRAS